MEALKTSPGSTEASSRRGGSKRRVEAVVTSQDSVDSGSAAVRVLRARGDASSRANESRNASCKKKPQSLNGKRRRPAGSSCKSASVMKAKVKKLAAKKASKINIGTKRSKSKKGNRKPQSQDVSSVASCKPEAKLEASSCVEESGDSKESNNVVSDPDDPLDEDLPFRDDTNEATYTPETHLEKSRSHSTSEKEVKIEETEKEEDDIKEEESTHSVDEAVDNAEPPRK